MTRRILVLAFVLAVASPALSQNTPAVRPGTPTPTGAQVPGLPPRDNRSAQPQTGTAKIRGRVIAQNGQPLGRAQLTLLGTTPPNPVRKSTTTDAEGRYEFSDLPAGSFTVMAMKTGFVNLQYGQRRPYESGTPVVVADGQLVERIDFSLPPGSVIVARITDDLGQPLSLVSVQAQRFQYQPDGQRRLVPAGNPGTAMTDDRGEVRAFGLMPGEYIVSATYLNPLSPIAGDASEGFSTTYYPGVASPTQAVPVTVRVGDEASVQFSMLVTKLARIRGTVLDSQGRPAAGSQVTINASIAGGINIAGVVLLTSIGGNGQVGPDGAFTLAGVPPGDYTLDVRPRPTALGGPASGGESASLPIAVSGADIDNVRLVTAPGALVSGRVVYEGGEAAAGASMGARVLLTQANPTLRGTPILDQQRNGTVDATGRFELAGAAGRVIFNVAFLNPQAAQPVSWTMKSITHEGRDITDEPIDLAGRSSLSDIVITMTSRQTTINGQVSDGRGQQSRDYVVVVLPAEVKDPIVMNRYTRITRPNTEGRFEIRGLRPGRYVAVAVEALEQGRQFAPEFQQQLRQAGREFTLGEGQTTTLDLRLTPDL